MKPIDEVLKKISDIIDTYESGAYKGLPDMHRELTCNMYYLSQVQVQAHNDWNKEYYNSSETSNAAKERMADRKIPELYMCRKIMETAKGVAISMGYELKMH